MSGTLVDSTTTASFSSTTSKPSILPRSVSGDEHLEPRELGDEIDHRLAQQVALAGQEHVDRAERVLVLDRGHERRAELVGGGGAALGAVGHAADREDAGGTDREHRRRPRSRRAASSDRTGRRPTTGSIGAPAAGGTSPNAGGAANWLGGTVRRGDRRGRHRSDGRLVTVARPRRRTGLSGRGRRRGRRRERRRRGLDRRRGQRGRQVGRRRLIGPGARRGRRHPRGIVHRFDPIRSIRAHSVVPVQVFHNARYQAGASAGAALALSVRPRTGDAHRPRTGHGCAPLPTRA